MRALSRDSKEEPDKGENITSGRKPETWIPVFKPQMGANISPTLFSTVAPTDRTHREDQEITCALAESQGVETDMLCT
jgi:hypothetical protein